MPGFLTRQGRTNGCRRPAVRQSQTAATLPAPLFRYGAMLGPVLVPL
jgi:hypothetical protein